jgi:hypothetical protein
MADCLSPSIAARHLQASLCGGNSTVNSMRISENVWCRNSLNGSGKI